MHKTKSCQSTFVDAEEGELIKYLMIMTLNCNVNKRIKANRCHYLKIADGVLIKES